MDSQEMDPASQISISPDLDKRSIDVAFLCLWPYRYWGALKFLRSLISLLFSPCLAAVLFSISGTPSLHLPVLDIAYPFLAPGCSTSYAPSLTKISPWLQRDPPVLCPLQHTTLSSSPSSSDLIYKFGTYFNSQPQHPPILHG